MEERSGKVMGLRVNCVGDRLARREATFVPVAVPRMHPLFNLEGDDPLDTADVLGRDWVAGPYRREGASTAAGLADDCSNPEARNLLLRLGVEEGKWAGLRSSWNDPAIGSVLVVNRRVADVGVDAVKGLSRLVQEVALPLMTEDLALRLGAEGDVAEAILQGIQTGWE
ncbi:mynd finger domain protein [Colletotrichum tofieldiae]|nr:MYND finger domain protein [Colletotrichum tofieldiae]GKT81410.1 mynd finger domain protein [Colletotrichum tofieldiae]